MIRIQVKFKVKSDPNNAWVIDYNATFKDDIEVIVTTKQC